MPQVDVMDLTTVCSTFPKLNANNINRDNILNAIDMYLDKDIDILIVEGGDGIGKTTLMAQYALRFPNNTFSVFIKSTSRWAYDPEMLLKDLANQLTWVIFNKELSSDVEVDRSYLRNCYLHLQRKTQYRKVRFVFIIDGIEEIPRDSLDIQEQILDLFPFGFSGFKFIITGDINNLPNKYFNKISHKTFPLVPFSPDETRAFLSGVVTENFLSEIYRTCKGIPEYLAAIKRIIEGGAEVQSLVNDLSNKLPDLFDIEWNKINFNNNKLIKLLGILAHDRKKHSLTNLARILQLEKDKVISLITSISFIVIENDEVNFVSESFRKYAVNQLHNIRKEIIDLLIDDLLTNVDSHESLVLLPGYYDDAERYDDLLNYLSPEYFTRIIECSQTMSPLKQQATLGIDISLKVGRDSDLLRFGAEKSIFLGTDRARALISELEALIALDKDDEALTLAQSAVLKEDLLQSLAVVARKRIEKSKTIGQELLDQISNLYNQIDPSSLGHRGLEIATDLIFSLPELAIELVEKSYSSNSDERALDWAVAKLSVAAAIVSNQNGTDVEDQIRQKIKNPGAKNISAAASFILGDYDADDVIKEALRFENPLDGLFMLRLWTTQKREREDAAKVIEYAIELSIKTTEYTPSARDYRELAAPLPYLKDKNVIKELISQFDALKGSLIKYGPSEDYLRLQLILAHAEKNIDEPASHNRVLENFLFFISELDDLSIKTSCIARVYVVLDKVDPEKALEDQFQFHTLVSNNLDSSIEILLGSTGEHYTVTKPILKALSKDKPDYAFKIAKKLNLETRRNRAIYDIIDTHINQPINRIKFDFLTNAIKGFTDPDFIDDSLLNIFLRLSDSSNEDADIYIKNILPLIAFTENLDNAPVKCNTLGLVLTFLSKVSGDKYIGLKEKIKGKIRSAWDAIENGWTKVDFGFRTAEALAPISKVDGQLFYSDAENLKRDVELNDDTAVGIYLSCLRLTIRSFIGLLKRKIDAPEDLEQLQFAIDKLSSKSERIKAWADVATGFIINDRIDDAKRITNEFIRPNLYINLGRDTSYWSEITIYVAHVLFSVNPISAHNEIEKLKPKERDEALSSICKFLFNNCLINDPYDYHSGTGFDISYDEAISIIDLVNRMTTDFKIYYQIECLADSITSPKGKDKFTKEQKIDIARRLEKVIEQKLPDPNNIHHEGFKIAGLSQIYRINPTNQQTWDSLLDRARQIPNTSDQVFVLGIILSAMPNKMLDKKKAILSEAGKLAETIPALFDRIERYESLANNCVDIDQGMSKRFIDIGIRAALTREDPDALSAQRSLIDLAYSIIGPDFASSLASLADDDPARKNAKSNLSQRIKLQEFKHDVIEKKEQKTKSVSDYERFPRVAWMLLSALNADRIKTLHLEDMREYIELASVLPIQKAYPIFAWIVQNAIKRFSDTDQARSIIKNIFIALLTVTELSGRVVKCTSEQKTLTSTHPVITEEGISTIIHAGEREIALSIIKDWLLNEVKDYIKICDPFFCLADLELLQLVMETNPTCKIFISTSKKQQEQECVVVPWDTAYRNYWKVKISDQVPPECDIVIVGTEKSGEHPIHDRWWVSRGGGFRMGTSFKSLGIGKDSEVSKLSPRDAQTIEVEIDRYIIRKIREHDGDRLVYTIFTL